ncbi:hypothetical protein DFR30_2013 [Thiogranum longum]|uniref:Nucleoprotein/polynucleotide-associated enzyme n=1 Tax=Thiogranum longum TaxID=1537524 RepID=A0A4R1HH80_9GAMM|nr:DUF2058 domain-containing protein [Thiogranum longum]TCK18729.1 hypothetical protein DFR30_2013 [Thiogranum longum]
MANTFGDQLLKAGLVSKDKLNKTKKSKYKQQKAGNNKGTDEAAASARRLAAEQAARDRELNLQRKQAAEDKAIQAQVRQLIEMNRLGRDGGEVGYNFQDGTVVRKIFVTEEIHDRLGHGHLSIARFDDGYEVIPTVVAEKIKLRDQACIVSKVDSLPASEENDPYADYKVPDDLMW